MYIFPQIGFYNEGVLFSCLLLKIDQYEGCITQSVPVSKGFSVLYGDNLHVHNMHVACQGVLSCKVALPSSGNVILQLYS